MISRPGLVHLFFAAGVFLSQGGWCQAQEGASFAAARKGFETKLLKKESEDSAPADPPKELFKLIRYKSPAGELAAYVSPDPGDGKKHPLVIWITGGFSNSISELSWEEDIPVGNDQSASAFRKAGIPMMYPSFRGGNDNPGSKEGFFGEVDDVLAATAHAAALPWVDPSRIYLGGHSTGGTLALLAAEAAPQGLFRAVFSFGPVDEVAGYGQRYLPFDVKDAKESRLRAPVEFLSSISARTLVIEGKDGNSDSVEALRARNKNGKLSFFTIDGEDHFTILGPTTALLAKEVLADTGKEPSFRLGAAEIRSNCREARENNFQPAGNLQAKGSTFGMVFYYTPDPATPSIETFKATAGTLMKGVAIISSMKEAKEPPFILLMEEKAPLKNYPVPEPSYFSHAGRGMEKDDVNAIRATKVATIAVLFTPADRIWKDVKTFNEVAHEYAKRTNAFIWDSATRECFQRDAWKKTRIDQWGSGLVPDIRSQITIHVYRHGDDGYRRAITLGMEKFGLPDVAIEQLSASDNKGAGSLMNVFCQTIAANPKLADPRRFELSVNSLVPASLRDSYLESAQENAKGKAVLAVMRGTPDEGDPENAQVALDFRHGAGKSEDERRSDILNQIWGGKDELIHIGHDEELEKVSAAARVKLLTLKGKFRAGLEPGSRLMVKGPFARDDEGSEWMWIEVLKWSDDDVFSGTLQNDPFHVKALRQGSAVSVKLAEAYDYILVKPDGSMEGNKTGELIEKQQRGKEAGETK